MDDKITLSNALSLLKTSSYTMSLKGNCLKNNYLKSSNDIEDLKSLIKHKIVFFMKNSI